MSSPRPASDVSSTAREQPLPLDKEGDEYHSHNEDANEPRDDMYREQYSRGSSPYHSYASPPRPHSKCLSCGSGSESNHGLRSPPPLSSPSIASSLSYSAPGSAGSLHRRLSRSTLHGDDDEHVRAQRRKQLSQRLSFLAQQLTAEDELDESMLGEQVDELERAFAMSTSPKARAEPFSPRTPERNQDRSYLASPISSLVRSQMSQLSMQSMREEEEKEEAKSQQGVGMTVEEARKVMAEAEQLNDEMNTIFTSLRARQEETDHINALLVEGAERAAQRITFLQSRIAYLEQELYHNDDELQHLRICLKAVEVQLPPHPDRELQRCIQVFKQDYNSLKQKRAFRSSLAMSTMTARSPDTTTTSVSMSPSRSKAQLRR